MARARSTVSQNPFGGKASGILLAMNTIRRSLPGGMPRYRAVARASFGQEHGPT